MQQFQIYSKTVVFRKIETLVIRAEIKAFFTL